MNNIILAQLYAQKGKLITNIELASEELKIINQKIYQIKKNEIQQAPIKGINKQEEPNGGTNGNGDKSGTGRVRNNSKRSNRRVDKPMQG